MLTCPHFLNLQLHFLYLLFDLKDFFFFIFPIKVIVINHLLSVADHRLFLFKNFIIIVNSLAYQS